MKLTSIVIFACFHALARSADEREFNDVTITESQSDDHSEFANDLLDKLEKKAILSSAASSKILATFNVKGVNRESGQAFTKTTISSLTVGGDADAAEKFVSRLTSLFGKDGQARHLVEYLLELTLDNDLLSAKDGAELASNNGYGVSIKVTRYSSSTKDFEGKPKDKPHDTKPVDQQPLPRCKDDGFDLFSEAFKSIGGGIADVSTRGKEVWITKTNDEIHRFKDGKWQQMPGAAVQVGASADGWAWVVNRADQIWRYNPTIANWQQIYGGLVQVSALSKDDALGVNRGKDPWLWKLGVSTDARYPNWSLQPRSDAKGLPNGGTWASIGHNDERWAIGPFDGIWRWNHQEGKWVQQPGAAKTIDVYSADRIVVTNAQNQVYAWMPGKKDWRKLEGITAKRATVGEKHLITLGTNGFLSVANF